MSQPTSEEVRSDYPRTAQEILTDPEFVALALRKGRISAVLTVIMVSCYFTFMGLLAFSPETLSAPAGAATIGIPLGLAVIVLAIVLTGVYVRWANSEYDTRVQKLRDRIRG